MTLPIPMRLYDSKLRNKSILLIFLLVIIIYSNSLGGQFVYDDEYFVVKNINIRNLSNIPAFFTSPSAVAFAALSQDVEAAARIAHPSAVPAVGMETVGDALAIVEEWRPGATLRALLDAGGRLPPDVAARVAADVCAALARAHAVDAGGHAIAWNAAAA